MAFLHRRSECFAASGKSSDINIPKHVPCVCPFTMPVEHLAEKFWVFSVYQSSPKISVPERALLEMAALVPKDAEYSEIIASMELTPNLRARLVQSLLEECSSVKAKRIFLHVAETQNHRWVSKLDLKRVDLGSGPRQIVKNGVYNKKFQIYLPKDK